MWHSSGTDIHDHKNRIFPAFVLLPWIFLILRVCLSSHLRKVPKHWFHLIEVAVVRVQRGKLGLRKQTNCQWTKTASSWWRERRNERWPQYSVETTWGMLPQQHGKSRVPAGMLCCLWQLRCCLQSVTTGEGSVRMRGIRVMMVSLLAQ